MGLNQRSHVDLLAPPLMRAVMDLVTAVEMQDLIGVKVKVTFVYPPRPRQPATQKLGEMFGTVGIYEEEST